MFRRQAKLVRGLPRRIQTAGWWIVHHTTPGKALVYKSHRGTGYFAVDLLAYAATIFFL